MDERQTRVHHMSSSDTPATVALDDCWNRIGVRGDRSCERLAEVVHCRNCAVYARAADTLLDRARTLDVHAHADRLARDDPHTLEAPSFDRRQATESVLVFRLGDEWLAMPTRALRQVAPTRAIHRVPHRKHPAVLGVVNIEGALRLCISLSALLGVDPAARAPDQPQHQRLLVVDSVTRPAQAMHDAQASESHTGTQDVVVFPVDAIDGVERFALDAREPVPATVAGKALAHAHAVLRSGARTIGLLDVATVFDTLERSLR